MSSAVMCSYNRVNGDYACENKYLLTDVLKKDWKFPGFVVSDWQGTHSTAKASAAGLDHEEPGEIFYGDAFKKAVEAGKISKAELDDHVQRILRSMFASGVVDDPPQKSVVDVQDGFDVAQKIAEQSMVLLQNEGKQLPLDASKLKSIAVIGAHADVGMISGGGSAQVDPPGGNAILPPGKGQTRWLEPMWFPTVASEGDSRQSASRATCSMTPGSDPANGRGPCQAGRRRDRVCLSVGKRRHGSRKPDAARASGRTDRESCCGQSAYDRRARNREARRPCRGPSRSSGILEAWYAGSRGADAVANVLFGDVNPSAKLAHDVPAEDADLPHPTSVKPPEARRRTTATRTRGRKSLPVCRRSRSLTMKG